MPAPHQPLLLTEVRRDAEHRKLELAWSDGHRAKLDYDYVRGYCPCAVCQGHGAGKVVLKLPLRPVTPEVIAPVGNYGISIAWSDQHSTGIYRFDFLREICPCEACRELTEQPSEEN